MEDEFQIIDEKKIIFNEKLDAPLPNWIINPVTFSNDPNQLRTNVKNINFLNKKLRSTLIEQDISYLFPVQISVINKILSSTGKSNKYDPARPQDICVKAPTGSGKTLAYVLPILQSLYSKQKCRQREIKALIILPTKNLASQVYKVFIKFAQKLDIKIGLISGEKNVELEKEEILETKLSEINELCLDYHDEGQLPTSKVDIIIATPGRLIDHIHNTPGFKLHNLRFLVVDEADRVFQDVKQDWLFHLNQSISLGNDSTLPHWSEGQPMTLNTHLCGLFRRPPHKLLFSATFSFDPDKLAQLNLFLPLMFEGCSSINNDDGGGRVQEVDKYPAYVLPSTLQQQYLECGKKGDKPLYLLYLLTSKRFSRILCFTKSVQSSHRLARLLNYTGAFGGNPVAELSGKCKGDKGRAIIQKFNSPLPPNTQSASILVCSDVMSRGMDFHQSHASSAPSPQSSLTVINYDFPTHHPKSYVHRVGRTARAGQTGLALSLVEADQLPDCRKMFSEVGWNFDGDCEKMIFSEDDNKEIRALIPIYRKALQRLKQQETQTKDYPKGNHKRNKKFKFYK